MNSVTLDELKELEKSIKKEIIIEYSAFISKDKVDYWLNNDYFNKSNYSSNKTLSKYQGELLRHLFSDIINVEIDGNEESKNLQEGLVEYYVENYSNKNNIEINARPDLKNKVKNASDIANKLGKLINKLSFTGDYNDINNALKEIEDNNKNSFEVKQPNPSLTLVYENNEQFIKYIDENNETHLVKSSDPKKISKLYKELSRKNIEPKEIFEQLTSINDEKKEELINSEEINMLDYVEPKQNNSEKIAINESDISSIISDIPSEENIVEEEKIEIENSTPVENNDIDYEEYKKTLEEGVLEPIVEDNYELEAPVELDEEENITEYKNDENYDFDKTGYIELITEKNDNKNDEIIPVTTNEEIKNENDKNDEFHSNDIKSTTNSNEKVVIKEEKEYENKKDNMYMLFYLFAITISIALIIGIIILKYYS